MPVRKFYRLKDTKACEPSLIGTENTTKRLPARRRGATREDVYSSAGYANVFEVHKILTESECKSFAFEDLQGEYPSSYRANERGCCFTTR